MSLVFDTFRQIQDGNGNIVICDGSWGPGFGVSGRKLLGGFIDNGVLFVGGGVILSYMYSFDNTVSFDFRNLEIFFTSSNPSITAQLRLRCPVTGGDFPIDFSDPLNAQTNGSQFIWNANDIRFSRGSIDISKTFEMEFSISGPTNITNLNSIRIPSGGSGGISTINTCGY